MKYFVESDEELALLLGHELSHYLQGHTKTLMLESAVCKALVTVVMAMIDPSGGIGGFAIEMLLPWIDSLIMAANSRECESEADMVGLEIVSRACYNPSKAVKLFSNMKNFEAQFKPSKGYNMLATHPLSSERETAAVRHQRVFINYITPLVVQRLRALSRASLSNNTIFWEAVALA